MLDKTPFSFRAALRDLTSVGPGRPDPKLCHTARSRESCSVGPPRAILHFCTACSGGGVGSVPANGQPWGVGVTVGDRLKPLYITIQHCIIMYGGGVVGTGRVVRRECQELEGPRNGVVGSDSPRRTARGRTKTTAKPVTSCPWTTIISFQVTIMSFASPVNCLCASRKGCRGMSYPRTPRRRLDRLPPRGPSRRGVQQ